MNDGEAVRLLRNMVGYEPPCFGRGDSDLCWYCYALLDYEPHKADCEWLMANNYLTGLEPDDD